MGDALICNENLSTKATLFDTERINSVNRIQLMFI